MRKITLFTIFLSLLLVGCSTKREYFYVEDENLAGEMKFKSSLSDDIDYVAYNVATLEDGKIVTRDGRNEKISLEKNEKLISVSQNKFITSNLDGTLRVLNEDGTEIFKANIERYAISASVDNNYLAVLNIANSFFLIDMEANRLLLKESSDLSMANYSNVANPVFAGPIIIYPSLDGKVYVVDRASNTVAQSMVISDEIAFNNVIFLESTLTNLYIATPTRLFMITPSGNRSVSADIKNITIGENRIFVLENDGVVKVYDLNLNEIAQNKFKFAIFTGAYVKNGSFYILEKMGYLIQTDLDLQNPKYYELNDEISDKVFVGKDGFYHGNKLLNID